MPSETRNGHSRNGRSTPRRRAPVKASGSWIGVGIGAIKSIVSAPLSWFGGVAEREPEAEPDAYGKRRLAVQATTEEDEGEHRKKRKRAQSPEKDVSMTDVVNNGGYNDPPAHLFNQPLPVPRLTSLQSVNSGYGLPRMMPVDPRGSYPSSPVARAGSAAPSDADSGKEFPRTNFTLGVSRDSVVRDYSLPPAPLSVHLDTSRVRPSRLSLTPQPSVFDFAPAGHRRDLSLSERPTLVDLPMSPRRLKRPSEEPAFDDRPRRSMSFQPLGTLDPIIDDRMITRSPSRRHSAYMGDGLESWNSWQSRASSPMNAAEKALQELDIYKTPLLPSRLRLQSEGPMSAEIPDMLRHNKVKVPVPDRRRKVSRQHDEGPPRLGMKPVSNKKERSTKERKPYAGEGGAKKLLARRRREEAEIGGDASVDNNESMQEAGKDNNDTDAPAAQKPTIADSADAFPLVPNTDFGKDDFAPGAPTTGASSLRVGRAKTSRASRPEPAPTRRPGGSRFSAAMEDEEEERHIETRVQPSAAPMYKAPKGFDFGAPPQPAESSASSAATQASSFSAFTPFKPAESAAPAPAFGLAPIVSITPATPDTKADEETTPKPGAIPDFFSRSTVLSKAPAVSVPVPGSLFGGAPPAPAVASIFAPKPAGPSETPKKDAANPLWDGEKATEMPASATADLSKDVPDKGKPTEASSVLFGVTSKPDAHVATVDVKASTASTASPVFTFGAPTASKPSEPASSPFTFGASAPAISQDKTKDATASSLFAPVPVAATVRSSTPAFASTTPAQPIIEAPKPSLFQFGQSTASSTTNGSEAPKSLFGGTSSAPSSFNFSQYKEELAPAFGAAPATPPPVPVAEKKATFGFGAPTTPAAAPAIAPTFSFGAAPVTPAASAAAPKFSFGASVSTPSDDKPFTFGANASVPTVRPTTPPRKEDNEISMDESPTRGPGLDIYGNHSANKPSTSAGFSFGSGAAPSGSALFGSNTSAPAASPFSFGSSTATTTAAGTSTGFSFGQNKTETSTAPSTNGGFAFGSTSGSSAAAFGFGAKADAPTSTGFSFSSKPNASSAPSTGFTFGKPAPPAAISTTSGFAFGAAPKAEASASNGFAFGSSQPVAAPTLTTSFSFGSDAGGAGTPSGFSFGGPSTAPPTAAPFSFGGAPASNASNAGSAPGSPLTTNAPFAFGAPPAVAPSVSNGFAFGTSSQPASPAVSNSGLPPASSAGFTFGAAAGTPPTSSHGLPGGFGAPHAGGAPAFNIGAPPAASPAGTRAVKKMPARRKR